MCANDSLLFSLPLEVVPPGTVLLQRAEVSDSVMFIESGRVVLGVLATLDGPLEHQLGVVDGPAWLEATSAVLALTNVVDAVTEGEVSLRRVALEDFRSAMMLSPLGEQSLLFDVARAHRQQTELAVSRLAKDAEARCAEWLLRHSQTNDKGCSVQLQQRKRLIAAQLGIAPETLSRVLRHLRERSLISGSGRVLNLDDPGALRSLAGV